MSRFVCDMAERRLCGLVEGALDLPAVERRAYLADSGAEPVLIEEAAVLLAEEAGLGNFLQRSAIVDLEVVDVPGASDVITRAIEPNSKIGPFTLLSELGEGGMGRVYLAQQSDPVERQVALKVVLAGLLEIDGEHRFLAERNALARLNHPNIARMYEAGATAEGRPYVAMELVDGPPIIEYCDRRRLSIEDRLGLFTAVCRGVQHAHQKRLLHRDLKPSNILVAEVDGEPVPKIIDFGIAEVLDPHRVSDEPRASSGPLGTPAYLSPEAAEPAGDVDTRSDVYALGVVLYELVLGVLPGETGRRRCNSGHEPLSLSLRWNALEDAERRVLAANRGLTRAAVARRLTGDLDAIVTRAIAHDRDHRYDSPAELAADVGRHLRHEPVAARPSSLVYTLDRFVRRHRVVTAAAALLVLSLAGGMVARTFEARRASRAAAEAIAARQEAEEMVRFMTDIFRNSGPASSSNPNPRDVHDLTALELLDRGAERLASEFEDRPLTRAQLQLSIGVVYRQLALYEPAEELFTRALVGRLAHLDADHVDVALSHLHLGTLMLTTNDLEAADAQLTRARDILESQNEARPRDLAAALGHLADLRREQSNYAAAEALLVESLGLSEAHLDPDDPGLAARHNSLGSLYRRLDQLAEAEHHFGRGLTILRRSLSETHPRVVTALSNLAVTLAEQDRLAEAAPFFEQVLESRRQVLGEDHPSVAQSHNNLGVLYVDLDQPARAVPVHRRALAIREQALGAEHPLVAWSLRNLAVALRRSGDREPTEPLLLRAVAIWEQALGPDHLHLAEGYNSLANLYRQQGRVELARANYLRAARIWEPVLGAEHPKLVRTRERLAALASEIAAAGRGPTQLG